MVYISLQYKIFLFSFVFYSEKILHYFVFIKLSKWCFVWIDGKRTTARKIIVLCVLLLAYNELCILFKFVSVYEIIFVKLPKCCCNSVSKYKMSDKKTHVTKIHPFFSTSCTYCFVCYGWISNHDKLSDVFKAKCSLDKSF